MVDLTIDSLRAMTTNGRLSTKQAPNAMSVLAALGMHGHKFGMMQAHRLAQYLAQLMHESNDFTYDREIWGPTPAQRRYEGRKDLGNVRNGDGSKFRGYGPIQLTGRDNVTRFYEWCVENFPELDVPNFVDNPKLICTDPWEGLSAIWYWSIGNPTGKSLNRYADNGDIEMVTKRVNGGLNGYQDRLNRYARVALVLLGFDRNDVEGFQRLRGLATDGVAGPRTRAEMHKALVALSGAKGADIQDAPVVHTKPAVPDAIDKPVERTTGFWERITSIFGTLGIGGAAFLQDWRTVIAIAAALAVLAVVGLVMHKRIIDAVKRIKAELGHA